MHDNEFNKTLGCQQHLMRDHHQQLLLLEVPFQDLVKIVSYMFFKWCLPMSQQSCPKFIYFITCFFLNFITCFFLTIFNVLQKSKTQGFCRRRSICHFLPFFLSNLFSKFNSRFQLLSLKTVIFETNDFTFNTRKTWETDVLFRSI